MDLKHLISNFDKEYNEDILFFEEFWLGDSVHREFELNDHTGYFVTRLNYVYLNMIKGYQ